MEETEGEPVTRVVITLAPCSLSVDDDGVDDGRD